MNHMGPIVICLLLWAFIISIITIQTEAEFSHGVLPYAPFCLTALFYSILFYSILCRTHTFLFHVQTMHIFVAYPSWLYNKIQDHFSFYLVFFFASLLLNSIWYFQSKVFVLETWSMKLSNFLDKVGHNTTHSIIAVHNRKLSWWDFTFLVFVVEIKIGY